MLYTALPMTCPTGANPTDRSAANSATDSPDVNDFAWRCAATRHCAVSGSRPSAISAVLAWASCSGVQPCCGVVMAR